MIDDTFAPLSAGMGIFRTSVSVASHADPATRRVLHDVLVDTGAELNWIPREILEDLGISPEGTESYETADGRIIEREIGFALLYVNGRATGTTVVFAEPSDQALLGAIGLEGLNFRVDLRLKQLVPAGPRHV